MPEVHSIALLTDEAFGWYFTGFMDGEGCFRMHGPTPRRDRFRCELDITLRDDDAPILFAFTRRLGCGRLYFSSSVGAGSPNSKPRCQLHISGTVDLYTVILPHFRRFPLQAKKARDFAAWSEAVEIVYRIHCRPSVGRGRGNGRGQLRPIRPDEYAALLDIRRRLKEGREYEARVT